MYKHCKNCGAALSKGRLWERHCSLECRHQDLGYVDDPTAIIRMTQDEMLDLSILMTQRKADLVEAYSKRPLDDWEIRVSINIEAVQNKIDHQLMRMNSGVDWSDERPELRVIKGEKK